MRTLFAAFVAAYVTGCSAATVKPPAGIASSYDELTFIESKVNKRYKHPVSGALPMVKTEHGNAFVLPLEVPPDAKSIYYRSVVYISDYDTMIWNVSYPTFLFFDQEMVETRRISPQMKAVFKRGAQYSMYFENTIELAESPSRIAALFSPAHFGIKLNYDARVQGMGFFAGTVQATSEKTDRAVPVGPDGLLQLEFKKE